MGHAAQEKDNQITVRHGRNDYNDSKKGVDISDQMASYYTTLRKSLKWYRKIILEIATGTAVVNAWNLYNNCPSNTKMTMRDFKETLALELIHFEDETSIKKRGKHTLLEMEKLDGQDVRRRCTECYKRYRSEGKDYVQAGAMTKKVITFCETCEEQPILCLNCFNATHKNI